jgi:SAM-dependent methyltransferase
VASKAPERFFGFAGGLAAESYRQRLFQGLKVPVVRRGRALDLGCGEGEEALLFAGLGYQVDAVDLAPHAAWKANARRGRGKVKFKAGDASAIKGRAVYDLVYEKDMLHHANDPVAALRRMAALCKPGGEVLVVEANRWNPVFYVHLTLLGEHDHFSGPKFKRLLAEAGLEGGSLSRMEARVWPLNRPWAQKFFNQMQDLAQAFVLWHPFVCYHIYRWPKPAAGKTLGR